MARSWIRKYGIGIGALCGALLAWPTAEAGYALLGGVSGAILAWAWGKGALLAAFRGALVGAAFLLVAGPALERLLGHADSFEGAPRAVVVGALVGSVLGIRNFRTKKRLMAEMEEVQPAVAMTNVRTNVAAKHDQNQAVE